MSIADAQRMVRDFHIATGSTAGSTPAVRDRALRASLIVEEALETIKALGFHLHGPEGIECPPDRGEDFVGAIDGLCDLIYVCLGAAVAWGIEIEPFFREVHRANMAKILGPKREDGKQLKPEGWRPPNIEGLLQEQMAPPYDEDEWNSLLRSVGEGVEWDDQS